MERGLAGRAELGDPGASGLRLRTVRRELDEALVVGDRARSISLGFAHQAAVGPGGGESWVELDRPREVLDGAVPIPPLAARQAAAHPGRGEPRVELDRPREGRDGGGAVLVPHERVTTARRAG